MKDFKIIAYQTSYKEKLYAYLNKIAQNKDDNYIKYCIEKSCGVIPTVLVVNGVNDIVGCHLFFNTSLMAKGEEKKVAWGHETFLDEDYRSEAGVEFVMAINGNNTLGIGYTDINLKIQKKLKQNVLIETTFNYFLFNFFSPLGVLKKLLKTELNPLKTPQKIKAGVEFRLVRDINDIDIPEKGYWHKNVEFDLIRDKAYLEDRFLNNNIFDYTIYENHSDNGETCYFVVRPILYRGIPTVLLVDYRYYGNHRLLGCILKATKKLAARNFISLIQTTGGMKEVEDVFNSRMCVKRPVKSMIHKSLNPMASDHISITPADSDVDFNR